MTPATPGARSPVFILGLGAQKSGTTWLHRYLAENENFCGGIAKEYHVWDAHDIPVMRHKKGNVLHLLRGEKKAERYRMQRSSDQYFNYFAALFGDGIDLTADITPSYSGLGPERLAFIRDQFAKRGIVTKTIILIRDPLSRIKSAVRYNLRKRNYKEGITPGVTDFIQALSQYYRSEECRMRTAYNATISNALSVFGQSGTYIGVYESMFEPPELERLSAFCGVPVRQHLSEVYVKKTAGKMERDPQLDADIRDAYRDVYEFCFEKIPETGRLWSG